jgi:hypothetical protein
MIYHFGYTPIHLPPFLCKAMEEDEEFSAQVKEMIGGVKKGIGT